MRVYLVGPMTGVPQMNFPAFDEAAAKLRADGYEVISPAELDSPESRAAALATPTGDLSGHTALTGETWGDLLARDVKLIADGGIDAVVVLDGWEYSRGARLETFIARLCHLPIYDYCGRMGVTAHDLAEAHYGLRDMPPIYSEEFLPAPRERTERPEVKRLAVLTPADEVEREWLAITEDTYERVVGKTLEGDTRVWGSPGGETRVTNGTTGGQKGAKPQAMHLIPWGAVLAISEVYHMGAEKYAPNNWRKGYDWSLAFAALQRHLALFWEGEDEDGESGLPHLAHAGFHILTLLTFLLGSYGDLDDRPKP